VVCFAAGHGELPLEASEDPEPAQTARDQGQSDLSRVVAALGRDGVTARSVSSLAPVPPSCAVIAVIGARRPLDGSEVAAVSEYLARGGRLIVALEDPAIGLDLLLQRFGIHLRTAVVVDPDAELGSPAVWGTLNGYGEHPVSAGFRGRRLTTWPAPRWVEVFRVPGVETDPLVSSSPSGWAETDPSATRSGSRPSRDARDVPGPVSVGVAAERALAEVRARVIVFGAARSFTTAELERSGAANDALFTSAIAWLTGRTKLLGIGPKTPEQLRVTLSAAQERSLFWGCVIGLPLLVGVAGAIAAWRRRAS
jgi:ABC-type uncharacterized transport system involved in gliding motility auxiliary subunit